MQNQEERWKNSGSLLGNISKSVGAVGCKDSSWGRRDPRCCMDSMTLQLHSTPQANKAFVILKLLSQYGSNLNVHQQMNG